MSNMSDKQINLEDIAEDIRPTIYTQDYSKDDHIDDVKVITLKNHPGEDGDFCELLKLNIDAEVEGLTGFKLVQINRAKLNPRSIKAWHLHFKQDEMWYVVPDDHLFVGLWDVRKNSRTNGRNMRMILGGGESRLLFIPRGVAHGSANFLERPVDMFYFVNKKFDINNPDEKRIKWDALGNEFWSPLKD